MTDIEIKVLEAWKDYHVDKSLKPAYIRLTPKDHYALSKALDVDTLITRWNDIEVLVALVDDGKVFFLTK